MQAIKLYTMKLVFEDEVVHMVGHSTELGADSRETEMTIATGR